MKNARKLVIKTLYLKKDPEFLTMLTPDMKEDVGRIRSVLNNSGYDACEATIVKAWEKASDDCLCMTWMHISAMTDELVLTTIMRYLTENE